METTRLIDQNNFPVDRLHPRTWAYAIRIFGKGIEEMPRIGWGAVGLMREQMDKLGAHHANVSMLVLLICDLLNLVSDVRINVGKALVMSGIHDWSEFGGGDIGVVQGQKMPELKKACRKIEANNREEIVKLLSANKNFMAGHTYLKLAEEEMNQTSDEAVIVKLADAIEAFLHLMRVEPKLLSPSELDNNFERMRGIIQQVKDPYVKDRLLPLIDALSEETLEGKISRKHESPAPEHNHYRRLIRVANRLQHTKQAPRTGLVMGGMNSSDINNIADHAHSTAVGTIILGWSLPHDFYFDLEYALKVILVQEIGKLYGGDIAATYSDLQAANLEHAHEVRRLQAKAIFQELTRPGEDVDNQFEKFHEDWLQTSGFTLKAGVILNKLHKDTLARNTDEAKVALIVSRLVDHMHYEIKKQPDSYDQRNQGYIQRNVFNIIDKIEKPELKKYLLELVTHTVAVIQSKELRRGFASLLRLGQTPNQIQE